MSVDSSYCAFFDPVIIEQCMPMPDWLSFWTIAAVFGGGAKLLWELRRLRMDRKRELTLKRTEFFLEQHRRLYDDEDLADVIRQLDGDDPTLADEKNWEKNRKFLTFIEEIQILLMSGNLDAPTTYHMFGYFACRARDGKNFNKGIAADDVHWILFKKFCVNYEKYLLQNPAGPKSWQKLPK